MSDAVKGDGRPPRSNATAAAARSRPTLRAERAAVTRSRIADAARLLFASSGYGATTLQAIADEAGVAVQTVYAVFGSKAGILRELRTAVVHQPAAEAMYEAALRAPREEEALALFASSIRARWEAGADVVRISQDAAATDPSTRDEVELILHRRRRGIAGLVETLAGPLRRDLDPRRAWAVADALTLPELYLELTGPCGWSPEQYEAWLIGALDRELLGRCP
jgi:AcrR family transcriptional regulator